MVRHYHGHLSAVYCMSLHPTIDVLVTGSRDASARVRMGGEKVRETGGGGGGGGGMLGEG